MTGVYTERLQISLRLSSCYTKTWTAVAWPSKTEWKCAGSAASTGLIDTEKLPSVYFPRQYICVFLGRSHLSASQAFSQSLQGLEKTPYILTAPTY